MIIYGKNYWRRTKFERIRRVTGYLAGDVDRFNNGKRAEERDRVKHSGIKEILSQKEGK